MKRKSFYGRYRKNKKGTVNIPRAHQIASPSTELAGEKNANTKRNYWLSRASGGCNKNWGGNFHQLGRAENSKDLTLGDVLKERTRIPSVNTSRRTGGGFSRIMQVVGIFLLGWRLEEDRGSKGIHVRGKNGLGGRDVGLNRFAEGTERETRKGPFGGLFPT